MNYGKKSIKENQRKLKTKKHNRRFIHTFLKAAIVCILLLAAVCIGGFAVYASNLIASCPPIEDVDVTPNGFLTTVLDADGNTIETLAASGANREYVTLKEIPNDLANAFVAIEDERFYEHSGIDIRGIARAAVTGITSGGSFSQGASTITQQLLKNNYFSSWTSEVTFRDRLDRKIQEQYLAIQLEKVMSKEDILENYLNTINLGQNTLGVKAASKRYFNKEVSDLTLSESAVVATITQNPSRYNPITNPDENAKRRLKVLGDMLSQGYISQKQYDTAIADDVYKRIEIVNSELDSGTTSYFVDALCEQVIDDLVNELGLSESEALQKLYSGGLTIHATQNANIQAICDEEVNNRSNYPSNPLTSFSYRLTIEKADGSLENYSEQTMLSYYQSANSNYDINYASEEEANEAIEKYKSEIMEPGDKIAEGGESLFFTLQPQAAITIIDQSTGQVQALVGGRGDKTASRTLNRATGITRQPGSTFKIIAAYAPAIDAGGMSLATAIDDSPMDYANGRTLQNYDNQYRGLTPIRTGIIHSINVMAVRTLTEIGTGLGFQYAQDFGITTLDNADNNQALALGGLTYGVKNIDLTGAYAAIANGGEYNRPAFYTTIEDYNGDVILDTTDDTPKRVIKETTAWLLTNAMQDVMTKGTGTPANFSGMHVAGKSGTTNDNRDTLFAGFSPYYTACIWGGYDDNAKQSNTSYSKAIWKACMSRIHEGLSDKDFTKPEGIVQASVCAKSGKLMVAETCGADPHGPMGRTEFFDKENVPKDHCDKHIMVTVCAASHMVPGPFCPGDQLITGIFLTGGQLGSADNDYMISEEMLSTTCTVHSGAGIYNPQNEFIITTPVTPDVNVTPTGPDVDPGRPEDETIVPPPPEGQ